MALGPRIISSRRDRRRGSITEILPDECIRPVGRYMIELQDRHTGKTKEMVKSNYISPTWENVAKMWQVALPAFWHFAVHDSELLSSHTTWPHPENRTIHPFAGRPFPMSEVILTNSDEAENTAVHWLKGDITAWASYWKSADVPAEGARGQINEAECTVSADGQVHKRVWDWSTQQGNGSYQTLGIGMVNIHNGFDSPCVVVQTGPHSIIGPKTSTIDAIFNASDIGDASDMVEFRNMHISGDKCFLLVTSDTTSGAAASRNRLIYCDIPVGLASTDYDGTGLVMDLSGETWTGLQTGGNTDAGSFPDQTVSNSTSNNHFWRFERGLWCEGTTMYWIERNPTAVTRGPRLGKSSFSTATATTTTWYKEMGTDYGRDAGLGESYTTDIVKIGSYLYATVADTSLSGGAGSEVWNEQIFRINEADGTLDATLLFPSGMYVQGGLTTDGTDLFVVTNKGIVQMDTAGTITTYLGMPNLYLPGTVEYAVAPWNPANTSSQHQKVLSGSSQGWSLFPGSTNVKWLRDSTHTTHHDGGIFRAPYARNVYSDVAISDWNTRLPQFWNDRLWVSGYYLADRNVGDNDADPIKSSLLGLTGANMFSRALLGSEVTKTSGQTMKVSYELTFPDMDTWWHSHPTVV